MRDVRLLDWELSVWTAVMEDVRLLGWELSVWTRLR